MKNFSTVLIEITVSTGLTKTHNLTDLKNQLFQGTNWVIYRPKIVFFCGGARLFSKACIYDLAEGQLLFIASMNCIHSHHGIAFDPSDEIVYVFGGQRQGTIRDCERYTFSSNRWTNLP
jgi:hypothetical protein